MITAILKTVLSNAGCNLVLYESSSLAGVITDQSKQDDIIGLIIQPDSLTFEVKGNGVHEHYPPINVQIMKQVKPEDTAENNEATIAEITVVCKAFIQGLIKTGLFKKVTTFTATKIKESMYDANVLGWTLPIDLYYLENRDNC